MARIILILGGIVLLLILAQAFLKANPAVLAKRLKIGGGIALLGIAAGLAAIGRWAIAAPLGAFGLSVLGSSGMSGFGWRGQRTAGSSSQVRSDHLEMELDHDSGEMRGRVLSGPYHGRDLDSLSFGEAIDLWRSFVNEERSRVLLETYLDRRQADWREHVEDDAGPRTGGAAGSGGMTEKEAYEILGISPGAGEAEIRAAHRRLMKLVHPDHGGTSALAARINEAKERLLRRHDTPH
ncbi:MAG: molecular chaperone DnaJ [Hyphomicrobiales bacterium]|nr:MAG: molecular chaperone DnaJ [Hyphomicrobiales bacterium]